MRNRLIIVPTYNELVSAPLLVRRIFKYLPESNILVVDDGSPDKTADAIRELQQEFPTLHLLERKTKLGLGSAYRLGFTWGLDQGYEELIEMDADLSHRVRDLKKMIDAKELQPNTDLVIGSRWVPGGKIIEVPITFRERENGVSKMSKNIVREAMLLVTIWGLKRFLRVK